MGNPVTQPGPRPHGPRPFDITTRLLLEGDPAGWLRWLGLHVDGPADVTVRLALEAITDPDVLDRLAERSLTVASWHELLDA
jgi:hypothetical protein